MMSEIITDQVLSYVEGMALHLDSLLPWVKHLNTAERAELLADLTQTWVQFRQTGDRQALTAVLEDWEATALVLSNASLAARLQAPTAPEDYTPWAEIRADLPGDPAS